MKISLVRKVKAPERGTSKSAGLDFFIPNDFKNTAVWPGQDILIPSGVKACIPENYMLRAANKSGVVSSKSAVTACGRTPKPEAFDSVVILGAEIVDEDYQGEIHIHLINVGNKVIVLKPGMKIAQFILVPVLYEDVEIVPENELFSSVSERGEGALGSTDYK